MASNSEQIEAKLCAYLEGEIDAKDRAEIERHLEKNPGHRKLLEELAGTRPLLSGLPRVKAPYDLAEHLTGHLERSVLLDGMDEQESGALRIGPRWPQYLAYAAVAMLAIGLGAVMVFVVMPRDTNSGVAINLPSEGDSVARMSEMPADATTEAREMAAAPTAPAPGVPAPDLAVASANPSVLGGAAELLDENANSPIFEAHPGGRETMFVVVESEDPGLANQQVATYLASNNISWQNMAAPMPAPMTDAQAADALGSRDRAQQRQPELRRNEPSGEVADRAAARPDAFRVGGGGGFGGGAAGPGVVEEVKGQMTQPVADNAIVVARNMRRSQALEMRDSLHSQSGPNGQVYSQFIPVETLEKQFSMRGGSVYLSPSEPMGRIAQIFPDVFESLLKQDADATAKEESTDDTTIPPVMQQAINSFVLRDSTQLPFPKIFESSRRVQQGASMIALEQFTTAGVAPEDRMDVVIVVQPKTAEPATQPATQPTR